MASIEITIAARPEDDWMSGAICVGVDPTIFDAQRKSKYSPVFYLDEAKEICAHCPVRLNCLEDAVRNDATECVRGGLEPSEYQLLKDDPTPRATPLKRNSAQRVRAPRRKLVAA